MSFLDRLNQRWDNRQAIYRGDRQPLTAQSTIDINKPAKDVWAFTTSPHSSVLLDHQHLQSFRVPGTPEGIGEQHCSVRREDDGRLTASITEIIDMDEPHRLVTRLLTGPTEVTMSATLEDRDGGCTYTVGLELSIPAGTAAKRLPLLQAALDESAAKVRALVEAGVPFTFQGAGPESVDENAHTHPHGSTAEDDRLTD